MASRSSKKEFRTSVILTETQFKRVRKIARANDASIAWVCGRLSIAMWMFRSRPDHNGVGTPTTRPANVRPKGRSRHVS
jgi:hypothetical protein